MEKELKLFEPLSDEEIIDICERCLDESTDEDIFLKLARAIEERHGIK